jgi:pSer/pThr/pTyr-binding forkhead associated (FHA) protein
MIQCAHMSEDKPRAPLDVPTQPNRPQAHTGGAARLVILRGAQAGEEIPLPPGFTLFGREEGFVLQDPRASRRHAQIHATEGAYILIDLQSSNGTFVNGEQVTQPTLIQHGDMIRFGDTLLTLKMEGEGVHDPDVLGARPPVPDQRKLHDATFTGQAQPKKE